jgi:hypothetical protein
MSRLSVWFVSPAWRRYSVTRLALAQRASLVEELAPLGLDVRTVIVADDENLDIAHEAGVETVELDNDHGLGRRFNAGFRYAADQGADFLVHIGSDDWLHADALAPLLEDPDDDAIIAGRSIAFVDLTKSRLQVSSYRDRLTLPGRRHGIIPWVIPRRALEPCGFAPIEPSALRSIDHLLVEGVHASGVETRWRFHDPHRVARVDFKSTVNINPYKRVAHALADGPEVEAWPALAEHYSPDLVELARSTASGDFEPRPRRPTPSKRGGPPPMRRIPLIDPNGSRVLATEAGAARLTAECGYRLANAPEPTPEPDLVEMFRRDLDAMARELGVEEPEKLPNKPAVIAAIEAKRGTGNEG